MICTLVISFFLKTTECETKNLSTDLLPTFKVEKLVKDVKAAVKLLMQPGNDFQMFKTISYRFQTMKNGGHLFIVKVCQDIEHTLNYENSG